MAEYIATGIFRTLTPDQVSAIEQRAIDGLVDGQITSTSSNGNSASINNSMRPQDMLAEVVWYRRNVENSIAKTPRTIFVYQS